MPTRTLTEADLRKCLSPGQKSITVPCGTVVTPSAREYLALRKVALLAEGSFGSPDSPAAGPDGSLAGPGRPAQGPLEAQAGKPKKPAYFIGPDGKILSSKPEGLTHVSGRQLVSKTHPLIAFRGKLDSLCASIMWAQYRAREAGREKLYADLEEILNFCRQILSAEITGRPLGDFTLLGLDEGQLRERSHNPQKFYGRAHPMISADMGPSALSMNLLRTEVREAELYAARAFEADKKKARDDIVQALNRLSSLFYLLILENLPPSYKSRSAGI